MKKLTTAMIAALVFVRSAISFGVCAADETATQTTQQPQPQYIRAVTLVAVPRNETTSFSDAVDKLTAAGYPYHLDMDFNAHSKGDYVALGYQRTDNPDEAYTGFITRYYKTSDYEETYTEEYSVGTVIFQAIDCDVNFNNGREEGNYYIRLYGTKDVKCGPPLKELYAYEDAYNLSNGDKLLVNSPDDLSGALDYENWDDGCDPGIRSYCYLYEKFEPDVVHAHFEALGAYNPDNMIVENRPRMVSDGEETYTPDEGTGSVFNEHPTVVIVLSAALILLLGGAGTAIIIRKKRNSKGT